MTSKTCGECKWFVLNSEGRCRSNEGEEDANNDCCSFFEPKVITNGDVIRQGGNRALAAFQQQNTCLNCAYYNPSVTHHAFCDCPQDKDCVDGVEAWLNAPADCVAKNGESAKQMDLRCKVETESEREDD